MIDLADILVRLLGTVIGGVLAYAALRLYYWREDRRARRALAAATGSPYRAPFSDAAQAPTTDPGEAWQAGVAAERARVLGLVRAAREASADSAVQRAADAIRAGVEGGAK